MIKARLRSGRWVRVAPGVYRLAGVAVTWHQRALAACLHAGPASVISHRSAAVLLGISGFRSGPLEVTVPPGGKGRNALARVHRSNLPPADRTVRSQILVTHPARTIADLARVVTQELLAEAVDDVLCRRLVTLDRLAAQPAPALVREVFDAWTPGALPGSPAEMGFLRAVMAAGLPKPVPQYWIAAAHARVDHAYPTERIAIEMDSFRPAWPERSGSGPSSAAVRERPVERQPHRGGGMEPAAGHTRQRRLDDRRAHPPASTCRLTGTAGPCERWAGSSFPASPRWRSS